MPIQLAEIFFWAISQAVLIAIKQGWFGEGLKNSGIFYCAPAHTHTLSGQKSTCAVK